MRLLCLDLNLGKPTLPGSRKKLWNALSRSRTACCKAMESASASHGFSFFQTGIVLIKSLQEIVDLSRSQAALRVSRALLYTQRAHPQVRAISSRWAALG